MCSLASFWLLAWLAVGVLRPRGAVGQPAHAAQAGPAVAGRLRALLPTRPAPALGLLEPPATRAFYRRRAYAPAWTAGPAGPAGPAQPTPAGCAALALLAHADAYGLPPGLYHTPTLLDLADSLPLPTVPARQVARQARFELLLTDGLVQLARHLRRGRLAATGPAPLAAAGATFEPGAWVAAALRSPDFAPALLRCQPPQREYRLLQRALARLIARPLATPAALAQAQLLALNLERWRQAAIPDVDYVLVNLPAGRLEVVRHGRVVQAQRLLIGAPDSPTPLFSSRITGFTLAPEWQATPQEAATQLLPYLQASAEVGQENDFLADNQYTLLDSLGRAVDPATVDWRAVSAAHFPYTIRQAAGGGNPLGYFALEVPNSAGTYLYGAAGPPAPALDCADVRLAHPLALAAYLLGPTDPRRAALPTKEAAAARLWTPHYFRLRQPLALHVRYATCAVVAGHLQAYPDVYGLDEPLRQQLFGPAPGRLLAARPGPARALDAGCFF